MAEDFVRPEVKAAIEKMLKNLDMSGPAWDDYDENGIPYWDKWKND